MGSSAVSTFNRVRSPLTTREKWCKPLFFSLLSVLAIDVIDAEDVWSRH
jgi:hypothetical protein